VKDNWDKKELDLKDFYQPIIFPTGIQIGKQHQYHGEKTC
jgi:hypothetical protein